MSARGRWCRRAWIAAAAVPAASLPARAGVPPEGGHDTVQLVYRVADEVTGCPDASALEAAVNTRVGREVFGAPARFEVQIDIGRSGASYTARIALIEPASGLRSSRALRSDVSCQELAAAVALAVSIAVDPATAMGGMPAATVPPSAPARTPASAPPPPSPPAPWLRGRINVGARAIAGLAAEVAPGVALGGAVATARFSLGVEATLVAPATHAFGSGRITVQPLLVAFLPCREWTRWQACLVAQAALLRGVGSGFAGDRTVWLRAGGGGARVGRAFGRGPVQVRAHLQGEALLPRSLFVVDRATAVASRYVVISVGLDALIRF